MVVKFRRIEDRKQSVVQLRRRTEEQRERRRLLPKLVMIAAIAALGVGAYLYYEPSRVAAPAVVRAEAVEVSSPVAGTLEWILSDDTATVQAGREVACLVPDTDPHDPGLARLNDLRLRAAAAEGRIEEQERALAALKARLAEEEGALRSNVAEREQELAARRETVEVTRAELSEARAVLEQAQRLQRLEALTTADYRAVRERLSTAERGLREAEARLEATRSKLLSAREALKSFADRRQRETERAEARVASARREAEEAERAIAAQKEQMARRQEPVIVKAPTSGTVAQRQAAAGEHLTPDEPLLTLHTAGSKTVRAFVPPQEWEILKPGKPARIYMPGREDALSGHVARVHEQVARVPLEVRATAENGPGHGVPVDIVLEDNTARTLLPGQVGHAVFDK
ncbi:MAG: HlyD family efflux transporter periplasmic adaptor subunit [Candidatus Brocadiia bacterium]